jgi:hypothetical protein
MAKAYVNRKIVDNGTEKKVAKEKAEKVKKGKVPLTPEEKSEHNKAKQEAREKVIRFCILHGQEEGIDEAIKLLFPNALKAKKQKENAAQTLLNIIGPEGTKHEDLIWKASRVGRLEMTQLRKKAAKLGTYCNFSMVDGLYRIVTEKEFSLF